MNENLLRVERASVGELVEDPANVRKHGERNREAIKGSLRRFGQQKPIVVSAAGVVVAGNGTLAAAKELGWTHLDVVRTELSGVEATAFAIADNRTAELAEWEESLVDVLEALGPEVDLEELGFTNAEVMELEDLVAAAQETGNEGLEVPEVYQVVVECESEAEQKRVYGILEREGVRCRLGIL